MDSRSHTWGYVRVSGLKGLEFGINGSGNHSRNSPTTHKTFMLSLASPEILQRTCLGSFCGLFAHGLSMASSKNMATRSLR